MVEELEPHLREKILYYLDEKSLSQARLVNKSWYEASNRKVFLQQCIHKVQTYFEEDTGWPVLMSKIIIPDLRILANFMVQNYKMNKDYPRTVFNTAAFVGNQDIIDLLSKYYQDKNPPNEKGTNYKIRWVAGTIVSFTKRLMFQVLFFHIFLQNSLQKSFQFIF